LERDRLEEDFKHTVNELSDTYEELSLIYRISETFIGAGVDEICRMLLNEATGILRLNTAAVLFLDHDKETLYTKVFRGGWDAERRFEKDEGFLWASIKENRPVAFCKLSACEHKDFFPGMDAVLICPLIGKKKAIGALVVAERPESGEFYSNEIKLLRTITSQAALFIENALLHEEIEEFFLGTIRSFIRAMEAASDWTAGHTERVTEYAMGIARELSLSGEDMERLRICCILHDIGKIAIPQDILNKNGRLSKEERENLNRHPAIGAQILEELRAFTDIVQVIKYHHEWWNGSDGIFGLRGGEIPLHARILSVADTFDAITSNRPYRKAMMPRDAATEIKRCSGVQFDPDIVEAFLMWLKKSNPRYQVFLS
jgi:putative nucleotidyltransferase with HDIG domain